MTRRSKASDALQQRIGYVFADGNLLELALTHVSALSSDQHRVASYQRLEFLGDHVLGCVVSDMLYRRFPHADEGELSRRLADLVRQQTCAEVARAYDMGAAVRLGPGEAQSGGRDKNAIIADVCEALIGAIHLDGGYAAAAAFVERAWTERMLKPVRTPRDAKTALQEWVQARGMPTPVYQEIERTGPDHDPRFRVAVVVPGLAEASGDGRSKRMAEQAAAVTVLVREGVWSAEESHD